LANILDKIIEDKRLEVESAKKKIRIEQLKEHISDMPRCRNFYKAITKDNNRRINVIAEIKKASPSAGVIRKDFDPVAIAGIYEKCGADAISVLTDEKYFQGKLEYLTLVKEAVSLPILRKDFIIDSWQIYEARAAGADAILLIAEALKPSQIMDMLITASQLTLTVLLEMHSADSLLSLRSLIGFPQKGYQLLGINNRDLATMKVDINTTSRLAEFVDDKKELVSESGIKTREHVEKLKQIGVGGCLIGQTLCENKIIEEKFHELFDWPAVH
jgi:indole-3-glycerol phosphate synthase